MGAKKIKFDEMPETIVVPKEFVNKKAEVLFIKQTDDHIGDTNSDDIISFFRNSPAVNELNLERNSEKYYKRLHI